MSLRHPVLVLLEYHSCCISTVTNTQGAAYKHTLMLLHISIYLCCVSILHILKALHIRSKIYTQEAAYM